MKFQFKDLILFPIIYLIWIVPTNPDHFRHQELMIIHILLLVWTFLICSKVKHERALIGTFLIYFGWSAIRIFAAKHSPFGAFSSQFDGPSGAGLVWLILTVSFATWSANTRAINKDRIYLFFEMLAFINAIKLFMRSPGLLDSFTVDSSFLAMMYPAILWRKSRICYLKFANLLIVPAAIIWAGGITGILALSAISACWLFLPGISSAISKKRRVIFALSGIAVAIGFGWITKHHNFTYLSGREIAWPMFYQHWAFNSDHWIGFGLGSFQVLGWQIQRYYGQTSGFFLYAHNEPLQILFETGIVGLGLSLILYAKALWRSFQRPYLFGSLISCGIISLAQSPLRIGLMCMFMVFILAESLSVDRKSDSI